MEDRDRRIAELDTQFDSLDFGDKASVLRWLKEMFELCSVAKRQVPRVTGVGQRISCEYRLLPDPQSPIMAPSDPARRPDWVLTLALNAIIAPPQGAIARYGIVAFAIDAVLKDMEQ